MTSSAAAANQQQPLVGGGGGGGGGSIEDPFFAVKSDVERNVESARKLFDRWSILMSQYKTLASNPVGRQELDYCLGELQNSLRNIEWDLDDLEETIGIVERNPRKFRLDESEVAARRGFVSETRQRAQEMKAKIERLEPNTPVAVTPPATATSVRQPGAAGGGSAGASSSRQALPNYAEETQAAQQLLLRQQDETLDRLSGGIGALKDISHRMNSELEEQAVILDEFGREMDTTESKLDTTMKKMARVLHMSNDKRQWTVIGVLLLVLIILIVLLFVL
uniref:t-SNARE coiled-coil homology domain-containing protein n=2 Tax=Macrostomum lignano TaxID=282301 RepID=A0A1I8I1Z8_9PLAT